MQNLGQQTCLEAHLRTMGMVHIWPSPRLTLVCRVGCRSLLQRLGQPTRVGADQSGGGDGIAWKFTAAATR